MPKTVKTTPEKEKNIFQRAFDRLPEGFKNFIRTIRDIAVSLTNRVIFGNKQAERLRKADVDEILRKEKEEREQLSSDDKDTSKNTKEKDTKEDKEEIEELLETEEWLAGFAGVTDIKELSERLTEAGVPHKLVESEGQPSHIICQNPTTEQIAQIGLIRAQMNEEGRFVSERTGEVIDDVAIWGEGNNGLLEFSVLNKDASQLETRYVTSAVAFEVLNAAYENSKEKSVETQELDNSPNQELSDAGVPHELKDSYFSKGTEEDTQEEISTEEIIKPESSEKKVSVAELDDLEKLSKDLTAKGIPHHLIVDDLDVYIRHYFCYDSSSSTSDINFEIELIEDASKIQKTDVIHPTNDNDILVRVTNGDETYITSVVEACASLNEIYEKEQSFLESKRELYTELQNKLSSYNTNIHAEEILSDCGRALINGHRKGVDVLKHSNCNPTYIALHYDNSEYITEYARVSIANAKDVIQSNAIPFYKIGNDIVPEKDFLKKVAQAKFDFEHQDSYSAKQYESYAKCGEWLRLIDIDKNGEEVFVSYADIKNLYKEAKETLSNMGYNAELVTKNKDGWICPNDTKGAKPVCLNIHYDNSGFETPYASVKIQNLEDIVNNDAKPSFVVEKPVLEFGSTANYDGVYHEGASCSIEGLGALLDNARDEFEYRNKEVAEEYKYYAENGHWEHEVDPDEEDYEEEPEENIVEQKGAPVEEKKEEKEEITSSSQHDNAYAQAEAEASAQVNTIIVYNAQAYNKALDNAKRTGQDLDIKLADTAFTVEVREGKVQGKEVQFKSKNEKSEKQFRDVIRSKSHTFIEGKENSIALAHGELQIDMKRDANKAFVEISKGDRVKTLTLTSNESPEQLYEQIQGAIKDLDKAIDLDEPEEFTFDESAPSAKKTLEEIIEDAGEQANGQNDYEYVIPDETNLDDGFFDPRYT